MSQDANLSTSVAKSSAALVPDWETTHANPPMASLKTRISTARPLGIVRCDTKDELLMIYDGMPRLDLYFVGRD